MSASVRVTLSVRMEHDCAAWGDDCKLGQLRKQALDSARKEVEKLLLLTRKEGIKLQIRVDATTLQVNLPPEERR